MSELEFKFCVALNCKGYPTSEGSPIFNTILDYIEIFYDKVDVISEIQIYLRLLNPDDAGQLKDKIKVKVDYLENNYKTAIGD